MFMKEDNFLVKEIQRLELQRDSFIKEIETKDMYDIGDVVVGFDDNLVVGYCKEELDKTFKKLFSMQIGAIFDTYLNVTHLWDYFVTSLCCFRLGTKEQIESCNFKDYYNNIVVNRFKYIEGMPDERRLEKGKYTEAYVKKYYLKKRLCFDIEPIEIFNLAETRKYLVDKIKGYYDENLELLATIIKREKTNFIENLLNRSELKTDYMIADIKRVARNQMQVTFFLTYTNRFLYLYSMPIMPNNHVMFIDKCDIKDVDSCFKLYLQTKLNVPNTSGIRVQFKDIKGSRYKIV